MTLYDLPPRDADPCHALHSRVQRWMYDPVYQPLAASIVAERLYIPFTLKLRVGSRSARSANKNLFSGEQTWWTQGNPS